MGSLERTEVTLRFIGPSLDPIALTALLGGSPSVGVAAGGAWITSRGREKISKEGSWRLKATTQRPGNLNIQIAEILDQLTSELDVWTDLASRFRAELFCGLFLKDPNDGVSISSETALKIGQRGLKLDLDIYGVD